ncbi:MAG: tetratricopeptide repeat protein, partial [Terriglobales bacterium]
ADVQMWRGDASGALVTIDKAERAHADAQEIWVRRARLYVRLHRNADAIHAYKELLEFNPSNQDALAAIKNLRERRHELRIGSDTDTFNYTGAANTELLSLLSRWNDRWSTAISTTLYQRFGSNAQTADVGATYRFTATNWITVTGGLGTRQDVAPEEEVSTEYGHGFRLRFGPIRGIESYALARNLWYSGSRVFTIGTTQIVYLPREWTWAIRITGVRTSFAPTNAEWVPSGFTRLSWPAMPRLTVNGLFAVGAEDFSNIDQIGHFAAHTFGGGAKIRINERQDISCDVAYQKRTRGRTQTSVSLSYGIRF